MTRAIILTCGLSGLRSQNEANEADGWLRRELFERWRDARESDERPESRLAQNSIPDEFDITALEKAFLGFGLKVIEKLGTDEEGDYGDGLQPLGVEAESLLRRWKGKGPRGRPLKDTDRVALLVSETFMGFLSGLVIATLIGRRVRVWCDSRPTPDRSDEPGFAESDGWRELTVVSGPPDPAVDARAPVDVFVIRGLTVEPEIALEIALHGFRKAAIALCRALMVTVPTGRAHIHEGWSEVRSVEVELSGGYKAMLPLIHSLLEYFSAFVERDLSVFFRHEAAPDIWIESGLRRLEREEAEEDLEVLRRVRAGERPPTTRLCGFGWMDRDGEVELTPEGWGLLSSELG